MNIENKGQHPSFNLFSNSSLCSLFPQTSFSAQKVSVERTVADMYQPPIMAAGLLIGWRPVPVDLIMSDGIPIFPAAIAGVALYGVNDAILHLFHDTNVVR